MNTETLTMDHWLVCPADLHTGLSTDFKNLARSQLYDLRMDSGAVECVATLADLRARVLAALQQGVPKVRIVLQDLGRAQYEALGRFDPAQAARLRLYGFGAAPAAVLGSLCTPAEALAAAGSRASPSAPPPVPGSTVDAATQQRYADALLQWRQSVAVLQADDETDGDGSDDGDDGDGGAARSLFDWSSLVAAPKVLHAAPANIAEENVVPVFAGGLPPPQGPTLSLRWQAGIEGIEGHAVEVECLLLRQPAPQGDVVMRLAVWLAAELAPGPPALVLDLGGGAVVLALDALDWQADGDNPARWVARRTEVIDAGDRQALYDRRLSAMRLRAAADQA